MRMFVFLIAATFLPSSLLFSQTKWVIPSHSAYFLPVQQQGISTAPAHKNGARWSDTATSVHFFFHIASTGRLDFAMNANAFSVAKQVNISVAGKLFRVQVPVSSKEKEIKIGTLMIQDTGFIEVTIAAKKLLPGGIEIASLVVSGPATEGIRYNSKPRLNAASVHLRYPLADTIRAISFYNEVTVPKGYDHIHSFYMANGFSRGYFGMQVNGPQERRIIFSVWDAGNEAVDRNKVPDSNKVQLLAKGDGVVTDDFGNEGTGGHSHWVYSWKTGSTYRFLVTALPDSATRSTIYTAYFFLPETQRWKLIAAFRSPKDGKRLVNLYSFNENFEGVNGHLQRKALFGNQWIQQQNGRWVPLTDAIFTTDATGKAGDRFDYGAGILDEQFYLWNGGFQQPAARQGDIFKRITNSKPPVIDYTKDADSLVQAEKDVLEIKQAVQSGKLDTTGSIESVYYHILKEGTGNQVLLTDTVTVHYKGYLLTDDTVFDQTKEAPATFPLKRLIRGWQLTLPKSRVGGKVRVIIPSAQAYGIRTRSKDIPPNRVLVFDIEVVSTKREGK